MMQKRVQEKRVQNMREMLSMRFRITHPKAMQLRKGKGNIFKSVFGRWAGSPSSSQMDKEGDQFCLKYVEKLSEECIILGNELQLNAIMFNCMQDYIDASSEWSIAEDELITNVFVFPKVRSLFVICHQKLHLYSYSLESAADPPIKEQTLSFPQPICRLYIVKRSMVLVLMRTKFELLEIAETFGRVKLVRRKQFSYFTERRQGLQIITVPECQGNILQVFFKERVGILSFAIYNLRIECLSFEQVVVSQLHKFCDVPQRYIDTFQISSYSSDIYLVFVGLELYAVKNSYFLDSIITSATGSASFVKEFSRNFFFLYHRDRFELYHYKLNEKVLPERFEVQCYDSIPLFEPSGSQLLDIKQLGNQFVFVYYQSRPRESSELNFWLAVGEQVPISTKIDNIYPSSPAEMEKTSKDMLEDKIEMALQMGLTLDSAYLQLWQRSGRASKRDYQLLISTQNYEMIAGEIEAKLKKASLSFTELLEVMESSVSMLQARVRSPQIEAHSLRQMASCHFLLCKYRMFQRVKMACGESLPLNINMQDYSLLTQMQIFKYLFELLSALLQQRHQDLILARIRALLTQFSLIFRLNYHQVLPQIAQQFKKDMLRLLKAVPELLPRDTSKEKELEKGVWSSVDLRNTEDYIILQNFITYENSRHLQEFVQSKFFKVYKWHSHGALAESRSVLAQQLEMHNAEDLFIMVYEQLLKQSLKGEQMDQLITFIEKNYPMLPQHLRGRFRFYQALYLSFNSFHSEHKKEFMGAGAFLKLKEDQLFEIYFQQERAAKKGIFLLKEIEPIYQLLEGGAELFMQSMFRFFQGSRSSWADLKIVLNKFNNEKEDFHRQNYKVFEIMVKAIMEKVRVGSGREEAGLDQVVSYLQNIPFPLGCTSLLQSLINIQEIRQEQSTLRSINIDMSLRQILDSGQQVIFRMVQQQMSRYRVRYVLQQHELKLFAYKILTQVNYRKSTLYLDKHPNFAFKSFLIILMEEKQHIPACRALLHDQFLVKTFRVDDKLIENIVIYLYRKRLSKEPIYEKNKDYIDAVVSILDENNIKHRFLVLSEEYADMFSCGQYKMKYPFFKTYYPTVEEVAEVLAELKREQLDLIDYEKLFDLIIQLKTLGEDVQNIVETEKSMFANHKDEQQVKVMQHELYTVFFLNFLKHGLLKDKALRIAAQIMAMDTHYKIYNIIVPVFLIEIASRELIATVSHSLTQLVSYYFNDQEGLHQFITAVFLNREGLSNLDLLTQIAAVRDIKQKQPIFDPQSHLFSQAFRRALQGLTRSEQAERFNALLEGVWFRVSRCREEYLKNPTYHMLYRLLLHNPYVLAEYVYRRKEGVNVSSLRALLTLIGMESMFDLRRLLQLGESVFSILMTQLNSKMLLQDLLQMFSRGKKYTEYLQYTDQYCQKQIKITAEDLLGNSIISFRNKLHFMDEMDHAALAKDKEREFQLLVADQKAYMDSRLEYPFKDKDAQYATNQGDLVIPERHRRDKKVEFNDKRERSELEEHLNYFLQPAFAQNNAKTHKTLADFYSKFTHLTKKKHLLKAHSLFADTLPVHSTSYIAPCISEVDEQFCHSEKKKSEALQKSQSLKVVGDGLEDEFDFGFLNLLPEIPSEQHKHFESLLPLAVHNEISMCLSGKQELNPQAIPSGSDKSELFESIVSQVYPDASYPLLRRIEVIWQVKKLLLGQEVDKEVEAVTTRLGNCSLLHSLLCKIEEVFSQAIFLQRFSLSALLQLVKENASEAVQHQEDMIKVAEIVGAAFDTAQARQSVLMMFLVRLCRSFSMTQDDRVQNHLKDQIILLQQHVEQRAIAEAAQNYARSSNQDLRTTAKVLQYFRNYNWHLSNNHIRIAAIKDQI